MSAVLAQSSQYVLIQGGDNGFPSIISASDAQKCISDQENYADRTHRLRDLMEQRGLGHVPFWFAGADVVIYGNKDEAWGIHEIVPKLPQMTRTHRADNDNGHDVGTFANKQHIAPIFAGAVNPLIADVGAQFKQASAYEAMTGNRLPRFGYRQTQSEGLHNRM